MMSLTRPRVMAQTPALRDKGACMIGHTYPHAGPVCSGGQYVVRWAQLMIKIGVTVAVVFLVAVTSAVMVKVVATAVMVIAVAVVTATVPATIAYTVADTVAVVAAVTVTDMITVVVMWLWSDLQSCGCGQTYSHAAKVMVVPMFRACSRLQYRSYRWIFEFRLRQVTAQGQGYASS